MVNRLTPWKYYNSVANGYDELHGAEQRKKVMLIIELLCPLPSWKVLDIGCGTGISMEGWPCSIEGIEPSHKMAALARAKGFKVTIASAEKLPFKDHRFDVVISVTCAHHFSEVAFREMARVAPRAAISVLKKSSARVQKLVKRYWVIKRVIKCHPDIVFFCDEIPKHIKNRQM